LVHFVADNAGEMNFTFSNGGGADWPEKEFGGREKNQRTITRKVTERLPVSKVPRVCLRAIQESWLAVTKGLACLAGCQKGSGKKGNATKRGKDTTNEGLHQNNHKLFCDEGRIKLKGGFFLICCKILKSFETESGTNNAIENDHF
jgi:hypothetical protein